MSIRTFLALAGILTAVSVGLATQRAGAFGESRNHAAIAYGEAPVQTAVTALNRKIEEGAVRLTFDPVSGYLRSVLDELDIPVESQVLVYSETSIQARLVSRRNPRAVFFNDRAAVGWVRGGEVLEVSAQDPRQGTVYYTLSQTPGSQNAEASPQLTRNDGCLACHLSWETLAVPGPFVLSVFPRRNDSEYANGIHVDHRALIHERWGGWYVTGAQVPAGHMGNIELMQPNMPEAGPEKAGARASLKGAFDLSGYPTPFSDVVALMVLEHQAHATNLITRAGWEFRVGGMSARAQEAVDELVDYFLFVDEAPLATPVRGSSGFAERFAAGGQRDSKGRSLRDLQLEHRMMRYPCSFMIYSPGFSGLPDPVKDAALGRIARILAGQDTAPKYGHLSRVDRVALTEILRETVPEMGLRQP